MSVFATRFVLVPLGWVAVQGDEAGSPTAVPLGPCGRLVAGVSDRP